MPMAPDRVRPLFEITQVEETDENENQEKLHRKTHNELPEW